MSLNLSSTAASKPSLLETRILGIDAITYTPKPPEKHTATIIWLHGLGDSGRGMIPAATFVANELGDLANGVKFILPHAPKMSVTGNSGMSVPSWFDVYSSDIENRAEDEEGLARGAKWVNDLIEVEVNEQHIPPERIILGGLSQGGALACRTLLTLNRKIGGVFLLSTYVPLRKKVLELKSQTASVIPILWAHGVVDAQVPFDLALRSATQLSIDLGIPFVHSSDDEAETIAAKDDPTKLCFIEYKRLGHTFSAKELDDLALWFRLLLCKPV